MRPILFSISFNLLDRERGVVKKGAWPKRGVAKEGVAKRGVVKKGAWSKRGGVTKGGVAKRGRVSRVFSQYINKVQYSFRISCLPNFVKERF